MSLRIYWWNRSERCGFCFQNTSNQRQKVGEFMLWLWICCRFFAPNKMAPVFFQMEIWIYHIFGPKRFVCFQKTTVLNNDSVAFQVFFLPKKHIGEVEKVTNKKRRSYLWVSPIFKAGFIVILNIKHHIYNLYIYIYVAHQHISKKKMNFRKQQKPGRPSPGLPRRGLVPKIIHFLTAEDLGGSGPMTWRSG